MVPVDDRIDVVSTTGRIGTAVGCASIPSVALGGCAASVFSSSWGAIGMSSSETEVPGGSVLDSGRVEPAKGWESLMAGVPCSISAGSSESDPSDKSCSS